MEYDPILLKLIAWHRTREEALARLRRALGDLVVLGVRTNQAFLLDVCDHPLFRAGRVSTHFVQEELAGWRTFPNGPPPEMFAAAAASQLLELANGSAAGGGVPAGRPRGGDPYSPWTGASFRGVVEGP
jgi:acetyl/propionyl-CoA carboxylase alpha subunit